MQENSIILTPHLVTLVSNKTNIEAEIQQWALSNCDETIQYQEILTDEEIMHTVTKDDVEEEDNESLPLSKISASEAKR